MATASIDLSEELFDLDALGVERAAPTGTPLKLDAGCIRPSRWANRHEASFDSPEFQELKAEIQDAGGNVQPIKVRPLPKPDGEVRYEVVFGHRRHRACLELGLQVSVVVEEMDDRRLWIDMERENRGRANLSAWEQGMMYRRAMDAGLFPSMRALAQAIGRQPGDVSSAIAIAKLPQEVVEAFRSPGDIQFRFATGLRKALETAPDTTLEVARSLAGADKPAADVYEAIMAVVPAETLSEASDSDASAGATPPVLRPEAEVPALQDAARPGKPKALPQVLMGEYQGKPVEIEVKAAPPLPGHLYVRRPGTTRRLTVPASAVTLTGFQTAERPEDPDVGTGAV
jgi:ParB family chromosome partitioning protein